MNKYKSRAILEENKTLSIEDRLERLERKILTILEVTEPIRKERMAKALSQDRFLITCDASFNKGKAAIGIVFRFGAEDKPLLIAREVPASSANEAELHAVYSSLQDIIQTSAAIQLANNPNLKQLDLHTDSKNVVEWILGKKKFPNKFVNKINAIKELIINITLLSNKPIYLEWHPRESTADLVTANDLCNSLTK